MALVVDDEETIRYVLSQGLADLGYECVEVSSGQAALDQLAIRKFTLVMLDVKMPGIGGFEVMKIIRTSYSDTCVVMVSALEHPDIAARAITSAGADAFIPKPWTMEELKATVLRVVQERATSQPSDVGVLV